MSPKRHKNLPIPEGHVDRPWMPDLLGHQQRSSRLSKNVREEMQRRLEEVKREVLGEQVEAKEGETNSSGFRR